MPAKDKFHEVVKTALIKDGWTITDDPLFIRFGGVEMYIDIGAEKIIGAEKNGRKIAVEIKNFLGISLTAEFQDALGQVSIALRSPKHTKTAFFISLFRLTLTRLFSNSNYRR